MLIYSVLDFCLTIFYRQALSVCEILVIIVVVMYTSISYFADILFQIWLASLKWPPWVNYWIELNWIAYILLSTRVEPWNSCCLKVLLPLQDAMLTKFRSYWIQCFAHIGSFETRAVAPQAHILVAVIGQKQKVLLRICINDITIGRIQ